MLRSEMRSLRTAENFAGMSHRTHKWKFEVDKSP